ncbi:MAG: class I SAM-dependent methyltransferase [Alphaproteobacteria bacterium]
MEGSRPEIVRTLEELDEKIGECDRAGSDDALRECFGTFRMEPPSGMPGDPFSEEYRRFQLDLYRRIAGKPYSVANEETVFDIAASVQRPFPFSTGSAGTVADSLISTGFILRTMKLDPGSRVLELGSGWGTMTVVLAMLGHSVTALDVEKRFCELVRRRAAHDALAVEIVNADFSWIESTDRTFDAVLFTSSFHHADDHLRLMRSLHRVLIPTGCVFFASEPIDADLSYPWGLRLDGQSLWSIRKHGWLELGFHEGYFAEALRRTGWFARKHAAVEPNWLTVWEARPRATAVLRFTPGGGLHTEIGVVDRGRIVLDRARAGTAVFGPYATLPADDYIARILFDAGAPRCGAAIMDVAAEAGTRRIARCSLELGDGPPVAELPFRAGGELKAVEVRLFCSQGSSAVVEAVEIIPAASDALAPEGQGR